VPPLGCRAATLEEWAAPRPPGSTPASYRRVRGASHSRRSERRDDRCILPRAPATSGQVALGRMLGRSLSRSRRAPPPRPLAPGARNLAASAPVVAPHSGCCRGPASPVAGSPATRVPGARDPLLSGGYRLGSVAGDPRETGGAPVAGHPPKTRPPRLDRRPVTRNPAAGPPVAANPLRPRRTAGLAWPPTGLRLIRTAHSTVAPEPGPIASRSGPRPVQTSADPSEDRVDREDWPMQPRCRSSRRATAGPDAREAGPGDGVPRRLRAATPRDRPVALRFTPPSLLRCAPLMRSHGARPLRIDPHTRVGESGRGR
jgi:hypothetical protein